MRSSLRWQLYVIVDRAACGARDVAEVAAAAIRGGADVIQLRDKAATSDEDVMREARRLRQLTRAAGLPLIMNDRVNVAKSVDADGVHLGQDDLPTQEARSVLGPNRLIGRSTHNLEQALAAQSEGADYIGLGPIFPTPTKPDAGSVGTSLIAQVKRRVDIPIVCIGGIDHTTLKDVVAAGADCIAVVRAVCAQPHPDAAAHQLKASLQQFHRLRVSVPDYNNEGG